MAGIVVFVLMGLYPPWLQIFALYESNAKAVRCRGYESIFYPPDEYRARRSPLESEEQFEKRMEKASRPLGVRIDYIRLLVQWGAVIVITGSLLWAFKNKPML